MSVLRVYLNLRRRGCGTSADSSLWESQLLLSQHRLTLWLASELTRSLIWKGRQWGPAVRITTNRRHLVFTYRSSPPHWPAAKLGSVSNRTECAGNLRRVESGAVSGRPFS